MKKHFIILILYFISLISLNAQKLAPDFKITDIYGHSHSLYEDYLDNDKHVFIEFFASGCEACQDVTPRVDTVFKEFACNYGDIIFLGIDNHVHDENLWYFVRDFSMTFPAASGYEGGGINVFNNYGLLYTPYKIIIAPNGKIVTDNLQINSAGQLRDSLLLMGFTQQACKGNDFLFYSIISQTDSVVAEIDYENNRIDLELPEETDLTNLRSFFVNAVNSTILIDGVEQISGESILDFSNGPLIYQITSEEGVSEDWTVNVFSSSSVSVEYYEKHIEIYPNPTNGLFIIETVNIGNIPKKITVRNILGQIIYKSVSHSNPVNVDLSDYDTGIYFIDININKTGITKKIILSE